MRSYTPTAEMIEKGRRFMLGQGLRVKVNDDKPWTYDWWDTEAVVVGMEFDPRSASVNVTLLHDGGQFADQFDPDDLEAR